MNLASRLYLEDCTSGMGLVYKYASGTGYDNNTYKNLNYILSWEDVWTLAVL